MWCGARGCGERQVVGGVAMWSMMCGVIRSVVRSACVCVCVCLGGGVYILCVSSATNKLIGHHIDMHAPHLLLLLHPPSTPPPHNHPGITRLSSGPTPMYCRHDTSSSCSGGGGGGGIAHKLGYHSQQGACSRMCSTCVRRGTRHRCSCRAKRLTFCFVDCKRASWRKRRHRAWWRGADI